MRKISKFILLFSLLILTTITVSFSQISTVLASERWSSVDNSWEYAAKVAPPELMQKVLEENVSDDWLGDPRRMKVIKLKIRGQKNNLYLVNTRVQYECPPSGCSPLADPLCGSSGCAYLGYIQRGNSYHRVFNEYLKSILPPKVSFLEVSDRLTLGLPCLRFTELSDLATNKLQISKFCYNGNNYKLVNF